MTTRKDNASLPAGSPMYYYCERCGAEMVLPELHVEPAPKLCADCQKGLTPPYDKLARPSWTK